MRQLHATHVCFGASLVCDTCNYKRRASALQATSQNYKLCAALSASNLNSLISAGMRKSGPPRPHTWKKPLPSTYACSGYVGHDSGGNGRCERSWKRANPHCDACSFSASLVTLMRDACNYMRRTHASLKKRRRRIQASHTSDAQKIQLGNENTYLAPPQIVL